jgi:hypothetical protein
MSCRFSSKGNARRVNWNDEECQSTTQEHAPVGFAEIDIHVRLKISDTNSLLDFILFDFLFFCFVLFLLLSFWFSPVSVPLFCLLNRIAINQN